MISDVLSDAISKIDEYLEDETYNETYSGHLRREIMALRGHMEVMRVRLDTPPLPNNTVIIFPEHRMTAEQARAKGYEI